MILFLAPILLAQASPAAAPPPPWRSVFLDCARPVYATDSLVCGDPALLALNARLETVYDGIASGLAPESASALESEQRAWIGQRNRCAFKRKQRDCVIRLYRTRQTMLDRRAATTIIAPEALPRQP